eukprot:577857-Amphidinium_carterae.1
MLQWLLMDLGTTVCSESSSLAMPQKAWPCGCLRKLGHVVGTDHEAVLLELPSEQIKDGDVKQAYMALYFPHQRTARLQYRNVNISYGFGELAL